MRKDRLPFKDGDEEDAFTAWRKFYCWTKRPGAVKAVKRRYNRRIRRAGKQEVRDDVVRAGE